MNAVVLRKSLKGNWGVFQTRTISAGGYYTYPRCGCPHCLGTGHAQYHPMTSGVWTALYVNIDKDKVLEWAKSFCMVVTDELGNLIQEVAQ